ncbi:MAG: hypothetical protein ACLUUO_14470 [Sellimonas intestinalis]
MISSSETTHKFGRATFLPLASVRGSEFLKAGDSGRKMCVIGLARVAVGTDERLA